MKKDSVWRGRSNVTGETDKYIQPYHKEDWGSIGEFQGAMSAPGKKVHTNRKKFLYYYVSYITVLCLVTQLCQILCDLMDYSPPGSSVLADSPDKNTGVGCHAFLQGIFLTQGSNPGLPHCRWIPYHLSHQGSPSYISYILYIFSFLHRSVGKESAYVSQICSRLENPRDKGAWWAAVYVITQSQT